MRSVETGNARFIENSEISGTTIPRDVKTIFLNGDLEESAYMDQPIGFSVEGKEHMVWKLKKSIYVLKQVSR